MSKTFRNQNHILISLPLLVVVAGCNGNSLFGGTSRINAAPSKTNLAGIENRPPLLNPETGESLYAGIGAQCAVPVADSDVETLKRQNINPELAAKKVSPRFFFYSSANANTPKAIVVGVPGQLSAVYSLLSAQEATQGRRADVQIPFRKIPDVEGEELFCRIQYIADSQSVMSPMSAGLRISAVPTTPKELELPKTTLGTLEKLLGLSFQRSAADGTVTATLDCPTGKYVSAVTKDGVVCSDLPTVGAQGVQGSQGMVGATGAQGATGNAGPAGPQGLTGAQGSGGVTGAQGALGNTGAQGATGAQGVAGSQGLTGAQGVAGSGAQGAVGAQGVAGAQGSVGAQGAAGSGAQGVAGAQGDSGAQGSVGAQGSIGAQGFSGNTILSGAANPVGGDGVDNDHWLNTTAGTLWKKVSGTWNQLLNIVGDTGAQGSTGAAGSAGAQGVAGTSGAQGAQGFQGEVGASGSTGGTGPQGFTGAQGSQGAQGAPAANNGDFMKDGSVAMTGDLDAGSHKIINVTAPTNDNDAANKAYVDAASVPTEIINSSTASGKTGYFNQIPSTSFIPPYAYTEVCFKSGSVQHDIHTVSESTAGGNCLPGDIGFIAEKAQRSGRRSWAGSVAHCVANGMRLGTEFEFAYVAENYSTLSITMPATWDGSTGTNRYEWMGGEFFSFSGDYRVKLMNPNGGVSPSTDSASLLNYSTINYVRCFK